MQTVLEFARPKSSGIVQRANVSALRPRRALANKTTQRMNLRIALVGFAQLGLFGIALWIPFRMARGGIRNPWPILAGWLALSVFGLFFASLSMEAIKARDSELVNSFIEGPHAMLLILFGWALAVQRPWAEKAKAKL
jgi:hypothetical protein